MIRIKLSDIISVQFLNKLFIRKHSFQHTLLTVKYKLYKSLCHFLNLSELKVTEGFVQFVLYSEQRVLEGMFPYGQFVEELRGYDVRQFDGDHILIPPMTKAELEELAGKLRGKGRSV